MKTAVAASEKPSRPLRVLELEDAIRRAAELLNDGNIEYPSHAEALAILEEVIHE